MLSWRDSALLSWAAAWLMRAPSIAAATLRLRQRIAASSAVASGHSNNIRCTVLSPSLRSGLSVRVCGVVCVCVCVWCVSGVGWCKERAIHVLKKAQRLIGQKGAHITRH